MRTALGRILAGCRGVVREENGWRLFMLLPSMFLLRPPGSRNPNCFNDLTCSKKGEWIELLGANGVHGAQAAVNKRRRRSQVDDVKKRVGAQRHWCIWGRCHHARQVAERANLVLESRETLTKLTTSRRGPGNPEFQSHQSWWITDRPACSIWTIQRCCGI